MFTFSRFYVKTKRSNFTSSFLFLPFRTFFKVIPQILQRIINIAKKIINIIKLIFLAFCDYVTETLYSLSVFFYSIFFFFNNFIQSFDH